MPQPEMRRAIRLSAGLTLEQFAEALGCTRQAVSNWETGRCAPGKAHRDRYLDALLSLKELG
jgi:transcriptional regulator with XRE-family HTH domain